MRSGNALQHSWTSWAQMTSLKSEQLGLAPMGVLQDGAELPEVGTGQDFPPVWSPYRLQALFPGYRSRGQDHGHCQDHMSPAAWAK